jgi:hypothetical protein
VVLTISRKLGVPHSADALSIVKERGLPTGSGEAFDTASVERVRYTVKLKNLGERWSGAGMLTKKQLSSMLAVSCTTISKLPTRGA